MLVFPLLFLITERGLRTFRYIQRAKSAKSIVCCRDPGRIELPLRASFDDDDAMDVALERCGKCVEGREGK